MSQHHISVIAHRGASGTAPENTLAAIEQAIADQADWVEIDLRQTADNALVVLHDKSVKRTTNGRGKVNNMTLEQLRKLDAGSWFSPRFSEERIPTLDEVLETVKGRCKLLIEVKSDQKQLDVLAHNLALTIQRHQAHEWCVVQSFGSIVLEALSNLDDTLVLNKLAVYKHPSLPFVYDGSVQTKNLLKLDYLTAINLNYKYLTRRAIRSIHSKGKHIFCWTVNKPRAIRKLIRWGVDGIITDYPHRVRELLESNSTSR